MRVRILAHQIIFQHQKFWFNYIESRTSLIWFNLKDDSRLGVQALQWYRRRVEAEQKSGAFASHPLKCGELKVLVCCTWNWSNKTPEGQVGSENIHSKKKGKKTQFYSVVKRSNLFWNLFLVWALLDDLVLSYCSQSLSESINNISNKYFNAI